MKKNKLDRKDEVALKSMLNKLKVKLEKNKYKNEGILQEEFSNLTDNSLKAAGKINIEYKNLFTPIYENCKYYVNVWDTRSFIGNRLKYDPSIDEMFVGGFKNQK